MKRKSIDPTIHPNEVPIKPELKKIKTNDQDENSYEPASTYNKDSASKLPNPHLPGLENSVDRFLSSLVKEPSIYNSKGKATTIDSSPICKNLNSTYKDMDENGEKREPFRELTQLKLVRKLAKLNKLDESATTQDHDFNEKISKKLELIGQGPDGESMRKSYSRKSESLKRTLESVTSSKTREGLFDVNGDNPGLAVSEYNTDLTPNTTAPGCISPDFFRVLTAQDILQEIEENKDPVEPQETGNSLFNIVSPEKSEKSSKEKEAGNVPNSANIFLEEELPGNLSSGQASSKLGNKRRQSFSVKDASSKTKAFQTFSNSLKNTNKPQVTPSSRRSNVHLKPPQANVGNDRRKSVAAPSAVTDSGSKKPSRKSFTPDVVAGHSELFEENKQLKKDLKRKNKEIETLKREKMVLLRKLRGIDPELVGENKENSPIKFGVSKVYCRVRPLQNEKAPSVVNYPEIDGMKSPSRGPMPTVSALKCIEIQNNQSKKSDFYFDRVFPQRATQSEVFEEVLPYIQNAAQGNSNICVVSFGSMNSGKAYTIQGNHTANSATIHKDSGMLPRAAETILSHLEMGRSESGYLRMEFGCLKVINGTVFDVMCQAERNLDDNGMIAEESYKLTMEGALNNLMWKSVGGIQDLFKCLNVIEKMGLNSANSEGSESSFLMFVFKILHRNGKHNFIQFTEVDANVLQDTQASQSPMKAKNKVIPDFLANLQKLSPETKEVLLFYNINPSGESYVQSKELLESSLRFTNPVKPLSSYL